MTDIKATLAKFAAAMSAADLRPDERDPLMRAWMESEAERRRDEKPRKPK